MAEVGTNGKNRRRPWLAAVLSLIMPGMGHIYCGRMARGIVLAFLSCMIIPILFGTLSVSHSSVRMAVIITSLLAAAAISLFAIIDSAYTATRTAAGYVLKDYNRWYIYVILILMSTGGSLQIGFNVRSTLVEAFRVPTASNYPAIVPNDRFLANKLAYRTTDPQKGDLVVFINPEDRRANYIKRVVAVAGDTVEIKDGHLYVNDEKLQRKALPASTLDNIRIKILGEPLEADVFEETNGGAKYKIVLAKPPHDKTSGDFAKMTVPAHHCFVMGDNRNLSVDSRHFGPVPLATIKGRADYLYWPVKDWSRFGRMGN
ncbi:MAG: signal peptidase I [Phycisphaerales bacterium]|nr:MAG: signal peptidase I [Phycisphaerales bacterium]